ncbi:MAG: biofilm PGA synthesis N-glycosyltransferase PgaC [Crocinitomicaceae bacterium]|jgi:biofilm PGA synthesis N-glycosyltransferase PgaC
MSQEIAIFFQIYLACVVSVVLIGFLLHLLKTRRFLKKSKSTIDIADLTVLIPFRNEEKRIGVLLESILQLDQLPSEFVFIDDHSDDGTVELIKKSLQGLPYKVLSAPKKMSGKKSALRFATKDCSTEYILTWDADVYFKADYFENLSKLPEADMYLLPAVLKASKPIEYLYEIDVVLANAINTGLSGISRPIMASGANFLYKRNAFNEVDDLASHAHMASGDDTYLLRDFRNHEKDVRVQSGLNCAIFTETPQSFREFIDQRLRWVSKTTDIKDTLGTVVAFSQFVLTLAFFGLLIYLGISSDWTWFTYVFAGKIAIDLLLFLPFFFRMRRFTTWLLIPLYEVLFLFYSLLIFILMFTYRPKWKGREIHSKKS